jgi:hypothetical protein
LTRIETWHANQYDEEVMKKRIGPEDDKSINWVPVEGKMLEEMYAAHIQRKAKRNKPKTFMNGYGMVMKTRKK